MASTYLSRTISSDGNRKIMTFSAWIKRATASATSSVFTTGTGSERDMILFESDGKLQFSRYSGSYLYILKTNRQFRDVNAWYHLMCVLDTTQGTSSNRAKIYVNGVQETSLNTATYPSQDYQTNYNQNTFTQYLGQDSDGNFDFDGCMSHVHYVDGTAYTPSTFGSTDATTGEWKINTSPSVTYGTNGFFLLKDDNAVTDRSGQGNNFAVGAGTLTKTEDCPSNVFATANPLDVMKQSGGIYQPTFSNGNLTISCNAGTNYQTFGTIAVNTGKYYWETKATDVNGHRVGVFFGDNKVHSGSYYYGANAFYIHQNGEIYYNGSSTNYMSSLSDGDIVGVALDRTNGHIYLHKNGQYADGNGNNDQTFANAVSISTKLGVTMPSDITYPFFDVYGTSAVMDINFGNGYFGTTAVSSAGTNASGIGIFEYDVPTGFTALSTKGLNL